MPAHDGTPFAVLMLFTCPPERREALIHFLEALIVSHIKPRPGFLSARVYRGEEDHQIVELFEWSDRSHYEAYRSSPTGHDAAAKLLDLHPTVSYLTPVARVMPD